MAVSEAIVGAGAALAGVLITMLANFLLDKRRHHWEDERRWVEVKRAQYVDLLGTSRSMFDLIEHAAGVQGSIIERGKDSLNDHQSWVNFHAGQEVLATMEERVGKWAQQSYIGWDELEIIAPWEIYDAAWQHFGYLRLWGAAVAKACHTFESQEHYDPADYKAVHRSGRTADQYRDVLVRLMRRDMQPSRSPSLSRERRQNQDDDLPLRPEPDGLWGPLRDPPRPRSASWVRFRRRSR